MTSTNVRMAEMVVSRDADAELVALGLGSCIGLAVVDQSAGVAGLAHIVLPEAHGPETPAGKSADSAVPQLIRQLQRSGAAKRRLLAVIVGGAKMFDLAGGMDIGARNRLAVRAALRTQGVALWAEATGGSHGRTVSIQVGSGVVSCRRAGGPSSVILPAATGPRGERSTPMPSSHRASGIRPSRSVAGRS